MQLRHFPQKHETANRMKAIANLFFKSEKKSPKEEIQTFGSARSIFKEFRVNWSYMRLYIW